MLTTTSRKQAVYVFLLMLCVVGDRRVLGEDDPTNSAGDYDEDVDDPDDDADTPDVNECHPELADTCFNDVIENLLCHVQSPVNRNCVYRDARDFCVGMEDALNCTEDIVDTSCTKDQGRDIFDTWMKGLRAVHRNFCDGDDLLIITDLLESSNCWKFKKFITCIEDEANITRVSDLLTTHLDKFECNWIQLAVGSCNANAERNNQRCRGKAELVQEAVAVFFAATSCGHDLCVQSAQPQVGPSVTQAGSGGGGGGSVGSAVVTTLVVVVIVVGMLGLIFVKHKVVVFNLRRPHFCPPSSSTSSHDDDNAYDRFQ